MWQRGETAHHSRQLMMTDGRLKVSTRSTQRGRIKSWSQFLGGNRASAEAPARDKQTSSDIADTIQHHRLEAAVSTRKIKPECVFLLIK